MILAGSLWHQLVLVVEKYYSVDGMCYEIVQMISD